MGKELQSTEDVAGFKRFADEHPCLEEHKASTKCVAVGRARGRKDECTPLFVAYKECMKKWRKQVHAERVAGAGK